MIVELSIAGLNSAMELDHLATLYPITARQVGRALERGERRGRLGSGIEWRATE